VIAAHCRAAEAGIDSTEAERRLNQRRSQAAFSSAGRGIPGGKVMSKLTILVGCGGLSVALLCGCMDSLENQTKKSPNSIIGKKTDKIEKFDPKAPQEVSDSKVHANDPILAPLQAYGPIMEQISKLNVDYAVRLFEAENGRYPKDYDEFMSRVIKANQIKLPVLPAGARYAYDEQNHKLEVVRAPERPAVGNAPGVQPAPGG
jgi:hypothetical protein